MFSDVLDKRSLCKFSGTILKTASLALFCTLRGGGNLPCFIEGGGGGAFASFCLFLACLSLIIVWKMGTVLVKEKI